MNSSTLNSALRSLETGMMRTMNNNDTKESTRIAITAAIVASILALWSMKLQVPGVFVIPLGALFVGLGFTSIFAAAFILGKGFELNYDAKENKVLVKLNKVLYKLAMCTYAIIISLVGILYLVDYFSKLAKSGNILGVVGIVLIGVVTSTLLVWKDAKEIFVMTRELRRK